MALEVKQKLVSVHQPMSSTPSSPHSIPLYHGTSTCCLDDNLRFGLGDKNPLKELELESFAKEGLFERQLLPKMVPAQLSRQCGDNLGNQKDLSKLDHSRHALGTKPLFYIPLAAEFDFIQRSSAKTAACENPNMGCAALTPIANTCLRQVPFFAGRLV